MAAANALERLDAAEMKPGESPFASGSATPITQNPPSSGKSPKAKGAHGAPKPAPAAGSGAHFNSLLLTLVTFLKTQHPGMKSHSDLAILSNVRELEYNEELAKALRAHDRVEYNAKNDLYVYKPEYLIRNKLEALQRIQAYGGRGGMPFKLLEDSWKDAREGVEQLEKEGRVLISRTQGGANSTREKQIRMVFYDEVGTVPPVDQAFKEAWASLKTPAPEELARELDRAGLKTTVAAPTAAPTVQQQKKKGRQGNKGRMKKMTNVHIQGRGGVDLTKDYVASGVAKPP